MPWPVRCRNAATVAGGGDRRPGRGVGRRAGDPGPHRRDGGALGVAQHRVVVQEVGRRRPARQVGAGAVRAVARRHRAADVDHHRLADADRPVGGAVVRAGAVRPGRHDDEVDGDVPGGADRRGDVGARPRPRCGRGAATRPSAGAPRRSPRRPRRAPRPPPGTCGSAARAAPRRPAAARRRAARRAAPRTCSAHIRSASPTAAAGPSRAATTRGYGSVPSTWSTMRTPVAGAGDASAAGRSSRGTTRVGSPSAGSTRQVSRSSAWAS